LIQAVNEGFEQLFGYHRDEVLGKTSLELNMFANASDRQIAVRKLQEHNSLRGFEVDIRTKFGETRRAKLSVEVIELNSEKFMLTVLEDITDRRRVETALRESEERHRVAIMNAPAIYSQMDRGLRYIWIHNPHPDFEGGDVLGKRDDELEDNEDARHLVELKRKVIESGLGVRKEVQFNRSDGIHIYDMTLEPLRGADGQITGISSAAFDITDLKRAEEALHANELTFRNLADAMPQLVWTARPDGSVDYYNQRYQEYDGIGPASYDNWMWAPVLHPDDIFATITAWEHAIKTGTIYQIEHRVRMADGGYCWHLSRGVPAKDFEGNVIKWYGTATNIHEQKEAEEKLKRSNQQLEQFAFIASHDLQEPLRKIRAFGNLLEKESGDHLIGESADHLKRIIQAAERMQMMINSMLELSRVTTHGGAYIPVDLNKIAQEVISDLETPIRKAQAVVQVGELPVIEANPVQMRQLLQNLIANAIKFHQDDLPPRVNLTGKIESLPAGVQMMAVLAIEDNGIGFEEREFERILQPFQRLHHHNKYEGMGMGLPICARIVERHGGKLEGKSQVGQGTTFYVTLPVIQEG
jgi:PAS domain S-box-containing protein